jgi:hypothetical protein
MLRLTYHAPPVVEDLHEIEEPPADNDSPISKCVSSAMEAIELDSKFRQEVFIHVLNVPQVSGDPGAIIPVVRHNLDSVGIQVLLS